MDTKKRAETALKMLKKAAADDDQDAADFLVAVVERDGLYRRFANDAGEPFTCMADFVAELNSEIEAA